MVYPIIKSYTTLELVQETTSMTIPYPDKLVEGNLLVCVVQFFVDFAYDGEVVELPLGWDVRYNQLLRRSYDIAPTDADYASKLVILTKTYSATDPSPVVTFLTSPLDVAAVVYRISGCYAVSDVSAILEERDDYLISNQPRLEVDWAPSNTLYITGHATVGTNAYTLDTYPDSFSNLIHVAVEGNTLSEQTTDRHLNQLYMLSKTSRSRVSDVDGLWSCTLFQESFVNFQIAFKGAEEEKVTEPDLSYILPDSYYPRVESVSSGGLSILKSPVDNYPISYTPLEVPYPTGCLPGDLLLAIVKHDRGSLYSIQGWTKLSNNVFAKYYYTEESATSLYVGHQDTSPWTVPKEAVIIYRLAKARISDIAIKDGAQAIDFSWAGDSLVQINSLLSFRVDNIVSAPLDYTIEASIEVLAEPAVQGSFLQDVKIVSAYKNTTELCNPAYETEDIHGTIIKTKPFWTVYGELLEPQYLYITVKKKFELPLNTAALPSNAIVAGGSIILAITSEHKVYFAGTATYGENAVEHLERVIAIFAAPSNCYFFLLQSGRLEQVGSGATFDLSAYSELDAVKLVAYGNSAYILSAKGVVHTYCADDTTWHNAATEWQGVQDLIAGYYYLAAVKTDGNVLSVRDTSKSDYTVNIGDLQGCKRLFVFDNYYGGIRADGTIHWSRATAYPELQAELAAIDDAIWISVRLYNSITVLHKDLTTTVLGDHTFEPLQIPVLQYGAQDPRTPIVLTPEGSVYYNKEDITINGLESGEQVTGLYANGFGPEQFPAYYESSLLSKKIDLKASVTSSTIVLQTAQLVAQYLDTKPQFISAFYPLADRELSFWSEVWKVTPIRPIFTAWSDAWLLTILDSLTWYTADTVSFITKLVQHAVESFADSSGIVAELKVIETDSSVRVNTVVFFEAALEAGLTAPANNVLFPNISIKGLALDPRLRVYLDTQGLAELGRVEFMRAGKARYKTAEFTPAQLVNIFIQETLASVPFKQFGGDVELATVLEKDAVGLPYNKLELFKTATNPIPIAKLFVKKHKLFKYSQFSITAYKLSDIMAPVPLQFSVSQDGPWVTALELQDVPDFVFVKLSLDFGQDFSDVAISVAAEVFIGA